MDGFARWAGFLFVPINVMAFSFVPKEKMNNATGMINLARNVGGSVGISLVTTLQARLAQKHQADLVQNLSPINPRYRDMLQGITGSLARTRIECCHCNAAGAGPLVRRTATASRDVIVHRCILDPGCHCLGMIPLVFIMKKAPPHQAAAMVH